MATKLFVGGLSYSTTSESLREYFAQCGTVESATVITDRATGQSRGFGFVEMATEAEGQAAIAKLNDKPFEGRRLTVNVANPQGDPLGDTQPRAVRQLEHRPVAKDHRLVDGRCGEQSLHLLDAQHVGQGTPALRGLETVARVTDDMSLADNGNTEAAFSRNRRIELKLTER